MFVLFVEDICLGLDLVLAVKSTDQLMRNDDYLGEILIQSASVGHITGKLVVN